MGSLRFFNINELIEEYKTNVFVETGFGRGDGTSYACDCNFRKIYNIEIQYEFFLKAYEQFKQDARVHLLCGNSFSILPSLLQTIDSNILFWLDAHYPSHPTKAIDNDIRLPLEKELEVIKSCRSEFKDIILMDDISVYRNHGKERNEDLRPRQRFSHPEFYATMFIDSHKCDIINIDEVYCRLLPL